MQILKVFYCHKIMESKIQKSFIHTNIKNIFLIACSYGYQLVCVYDTLSKLFETYSGKDAVLLIV